MLPENPENKDQPEQASQHQQQSSTQEGGAEAQSKPKRARGLAAADPETRKAVARKGGEAVSRNRKHMADIGKKGGEAVSQDRKHMASIGRKGGEAVSQNREHMAEIGRKGGEARGSRSGEDPHGLGQPNQDAGEVRGTEELGHENSSSQDPFGKK